MKLLPTTDDSIMEDGSIPSFWYGGYSYNYDRRLKPYFKPESFAKWITDNEKLIVNQYPNLNLNLGVTYD